MIYQWHEVDYLDIFRKAVILPPIPKRKPHMQGGRHILDLITAFDIETTRIDLPIVDDAAQNSHSFMYVWQFQLEDITIMGREWAEFMAMIGAMCAAIDTVQEEKKLPYPPRLVCFVHNLGYEWQWLQGIYKFQNEDVFLRKPRKPIYCRMFDKIEFRCSFLQTNMSLAHLTKQMGVEQKLSGQEYDYSKIRYPWTPLSDYEIEYCVRDVRSLVACMRIRIRKSGDTLQTVPLTSTGYVRRDCKKALAPLFLDIREIKPDLTVYKMLRAAFRGGNTHCNRLYAGKILDNVQSYDMTSCYPAQQLTKRFPMGRFRFLDDKLSLERVFRYIGLGYAVVMTVQFEKLRIKPGVPIPYISLSRTKSFGLVMDNGRILRAEASQMTITEIDLKIILRQYNYKTIKVTSAMVAKKDYLPAPYRDVIRNYYNQKTTLKGATDYEEIYQYNKSKELLNAVFGCSCQDPIHSEVLYDGGLYTERNLYDFPEEAEKALASAPFPYQWGVYITALAREALQEAIDLAGYENMVYCDTDSVKVRGNLDLTKMNELREKAARRCRAWAKDRKGNPHYMGVFEYEGTYDKFISQGAKRYAYIKGSCPYSATCEMFPRCKMGITVSGVSKRIDDNTGLPVAVGELGALENFREGMIWHESAGTMSVYNDDDNFDYTDPETGRSVHISPNIAILPTTYQMGYSSDYRELLEDVLLYGDYVDRRK